MSYKDNVLDKIRSSGERTQERIKLWEEVCDGYDHYGVDQVESLLAEKADDLKSKFEEVIKKLQEIL